MENRRGYEHAQQYVPPRPLSLCPLVTLPIHSPTLCAHARALVGGDPGGQAWRSARTCAQRVLGSAVVVCIGGHKDAHTT